MEGVASHSERERLERRYGELPGRLLQVEVARGASKLGLSLAGHRDRTRMSVFVCGMHPAGLAAKDGRIRVGDELLEVNGVVVYGRCHLNASAMIKGLSGSTYQIVLLRREAAVEEMAVKPLTQFPSELDSEAAEDKYCHYKGMHTVTVRKGGQGLGIMIIEGRHAEVGQGIFISDIQESSAAEQAGLSVGDMILAANDVDMVGADYDTAASVLKQAEGLITLIVANPNKPAPGFLGEDDRSRTCEAKDRAAPPSTQRKATDPRMCEVVPGRETPLEIAKERMGLGLSIVGGADTPLGAVIVHEVYPNGAAALDARLRPGDQILEVGGEDLRAATHDRAIAALRQTPPLVQLVVLREERGAEAEEVEVELHRKPGRGLGLSIAGRKGGPGVYISEVVKGGAAEADGRLIRGDQILEVNCQELKTATQEHAAAVLKTTMGRIHMKIGRLKVGSRRNTSLTPKKTRKYRLRADGGGGAARRRPRLQRGGGAGRPAWRPPHPRARRLCGGCHRGAPAPRRPHPQRQRSQPARADSRASGRCAEGRGRARRAPLPDAEPQLTEAIAAWRPLCRHRFFRGRGGWPLSPDTRSASSLLPNSYVTRSDRHYLRSK